MLRPMSHGSLHEQTVGCAPSAVIVLAIFRVQSSASHTTDDGFAECERDFWTQYGHTDSNLFIYLFIYLFCLDPLAAHQAANCRIFQE